MGYMKDVLRCKVLVRWYFQDEDKANEWFHTPNVLLGNQKPSDITTDHHGARQLLSFIENQLDGNSHKI